MLFGDDTKAEVVNDAGSHDFSGVYVNDDDEPVAVLTCDYAFAAFSSAALSMIPPAGAQDAAQKKQLSEIMAGNLYEVMNICSRWFMDDSSPHLRLKEVLTGVIPDELQSALDGDGKLFMDVTVPRYGTGKICCLAL